VMMLKHIGERAASEKIYSALVDVFTKRKVFTPDLGGSATTTSFMKAIINELQSK
jgi:isocitrate/isopropylmalate dehydrogenase